MEWLFKNLKNEWVATNEYSNFNKAKVSITQYIIGYYSQYRPLQYNCGLPPNKAEAKYKLVSYYGARHTSTVTHQHPKTSA